jgi:CDP-6-deoxy-D-xylo-4-hexulose-3-dehydrase
VRPEAPFRRRDLTDHLEANGVETRPIVAGNLARQPVRDQFSFLREAICPGADHIHTHGFYVGLSPLTTDAEMDRLVGYFDQFMAGFR